MSERTTTTCAYCGKPLMEVVLGWHCPACHATLGRDAQHAAAAP